MTRPIEQQRELWVSVKEAAHLTGRTDKTVRAWVHAGEVRACREPGGRLLVFKPELLLPVSAPRRTRD